jgi:hypothetical protein
MDGNRVYQASGRGLLEGVSNRAFDIYLEFSSIPQCEVCPLHQKEHGQQAQRE